MIRQTKQPTTRCRCAAASSRPRLPTRLDLLAVVADSDGNVDFAINNADIFVLFLLDKSYSAADVDVEDFNNAVSILSTAEVFYMVP